MLIFTIFFCCGIFLSRHIYIPIVAIHVLAATLILLTFIFLRSRVSVVFICLLLILLGSLLFISRRILPNNHIAKITPYEAKGSILKGIVCDYPQLRGDYSTFIIEAQELISENKLYKVKGKVLVKLFRKEDVLYGQHLLLKGKISKPYAYGKSKYYRDYLKRLGVYSVFTVSKSSRIEYLGQNHPNILKELAYKCRTKANRLILKDMPFTQGAIFSAMILGDRSNILPYLNKMFIQTGTIHMLAISGFNVGIVAFVLELTLKSLRIRRKMRYIVVTLALIFYCVLTGACAPVVRATLMAIVLLLAFFLKREVSISHSLGLAALIILIINPYQLFDVGFQLSFLSIISITYISPLIKRLLHYEECQSKPLRFILGLFCTSLGAWLGLLPFIAYYFKIVSPITILANIVVVPYVSLVVMLGVAHLVIGLLLPFMVPLFALPASLSAVILLAIVRFFNNIPFGYFYLR